MTRHLAELVLPPLMKLDRGMISILVTASAERHGGDSAREFKDLVKIVGSADDLEVFWGLYAVFKVPRRELRRYAHQALAGSLLLRLRPACPLPADEAIRSVLTSWEVSVEELPWYLALTCGEDALWNAIARLDAEPLSDRERLVLHAFRYWVLPGWRENPLARPRIGGDGVPG